MKKQVWKQRVERLEEMLRDYSVREAEIAAAAVDHRTRAAIEAQHPPTNVAWIIYTEADMPGGGIGCRQCGRPYWLTKDDTDNIHSISFDPRDRCATIRALYGRGVAT